MNFKILSASLLAVAITATATGCETAKQISAGNNNNGENLKSISPKGILFEWQTPYSDMLNLFASSGGYSDESSMFDIHDINGDGTPELIISPNSDHTTPCELYTFYNHEIVALGQMGNYGTVTYLPQMNLINEDYVGSGFVIGKYAYVSDGKIVPKITYNDNSSSASSGASIVHEINDNEVSLPEYDKALEEYRNARSIKIGRKYSFGEKSLDYALHCSESWGAVLSNTQKNTLKLLLEQELANANATGSDAGFEICDLNSDNIPELIISQGTAENNFCKVFYLSGESINQLEGDFGYKGRMSFDLEQLVFYALDSPLGNACWTLGSADLSKFAPSKSYMECGRKYILDETFIKSALY